MRLPAVVNKAFQIPEVKITSWSEIMEAGNPCGCIMLEKNDLASYSDL